MKLVNLLLIAMAFGIGVVVGLNTTGKNLDAYIEPPGELTEMYRVVVRAATDCDFLVVGYESFSLFCNDLDECIMDGCYTYRDYYDPNRLYMSSGVGTRITETTDN